MLVYNPTAGKGSAGKMLPKVQALLGERGFACDLALTEGVGHARRLGEQAVEDGCDLLVAAGGDGTINEVINGLMSPALNGRKRPALGVLPIGRGNDFAFGMGIPHELTRACDTLTGGQRRRIDIGRVTGGDHPEGRYFGNGVGLGFDTVVGFEAAKIKWLQGSASYLVAVIRTIFKYAKAPVYEITLDDGVLKLDRLSATTADGQVRGVLSLDSNRQPPLWTADVAWSAVDLAKWITLRNEDTKEAKPQPYITGKLSGKAKVAGSGRSTASILGSLDGQTFMWIRDGTLSHLLVEALGLDIAQGLGLLADVLAQLFAALRREQQGAHRTDQHAVPDAFHELEDATHPILLLARSIWNLCNMLHPRA